MRGYRDVRYAVRTARRAGAWTRRHSLFVLCIAGVLTELAAHLWPIVLAAGGVAILVRRANRRGRSR
jgi:hypothetical protein